MKNLKNKTALITGASSGIGHAFAYELAQQGTNLIVTARSAEKLDNLAADLRNQYDIKVWVFPHDLSKPGGAEDLYQEIKHEKIGVDLLINNAGFGKWTNFLDETLLSYEEMIQLNVTSLTTLTYLFLPEMLVRKEGGIINVGSTGSFQPCPYITTYCATKAYVLSFSEGLYGEFYKRGISITALCPGNTETGFQSVANADTKGMRIDTPARVAKQGLKALVKGESYTVVGADNYATSLLPRFLSRKAIIGIVAKMMNGKINQLER